MIGNKMLLKIRLKIVDGIWKKYSRRKSSSIDRFLFGAGKNLHYLVAHEIADGYAVHQRRQGHFQSSMA